MDVEKLSVDGFNLNVADAKARDMISDKYDPDNGTYVVGDTCINDDVFYICNTDIDTPEDFDSSKWDADTIGHYCSELKSNLIQLLPNINSICIRKQSATLTNGGVSGLTCPSGFDNSSLVFLSAKYQSSVHPVLNVGLSSGTPTLTTYTVYGTNARGGTVLANGTYEWFELWVKLES